MTKGYLSLEQIAQRWSCHANTARRVLKACPRSKIGGMVRYPIEEIERIEDAGWIEAPEGSTRAPLPRRESIPGVTELRRRYGL